MKEWSKRYFKSTRGRVVQLLRRDEATVSELAEALELTKNAIRSHLDKLERDELVRRAGKRPGVRKPETIYALTEEARQLFPKAYHLLFNLLLDEVGERLPPEEIEEMLRDVGKKIAASEAAAGEAGDVSVRAGRAVALLGEMGGLAELEERDGHLIIRGYSCPLAAAVKYHPDVCQLAEALLTEIIGVPVQEECEKGESPACIFWLGT